LTHDGVGFEQLSWRDPDGFVIRHGGRVLRAVSADKSATYKALLQTPWMQQLISEGVLPATFELNEGPQEVDQQQQWSWLRHEEVAFPGYPHEITALQLYDSGKLTLKVAMTATRNGWTLKDASAWNILHSRGSPVFVDFLSFEKEAPQGTWFAYGQFVRLFLLPLLLFRKLALTPADVFLGNRDGISPEHAYQLLSGRQLMSRAALELIVLPKILAPAGGRRIAAQSAHKRKQPAFGADLGTELTLNVLRHLERLLDRLRPDDSNQKSIWKNYEQERDHYSDADLVVKKSFVEQHLTDGASVLDLGCNAGEFSLLAAKGGRRVVAADFDHPALSRLYAKVRGRNVDIAPLLLNIGRPTPAIGWENREVASFLERASGRFDCILALGLLHHLLVSERATLRMLGELFDRLNPRTVILEWIDPTDPKFRQLAGLSAPLYEKLSSVCLERSMEQKFRLATKLSLPCGTRVMYLWTR